MGLSVIFCIIFGAQASADVVTPPEQLGACPAAPLYGCRQPSPGKSKLAITSGRKLKWYWQDGDPTDLADFADPVGGSASYNVCVYDGSDAAQPLMDMEILPGGGWSLRTGGVQYYRYKDRTGIPDGIRCAQPRWFPSLVSFQASDSEAFCTSS